MLVLFDEKFNIIKITLTQYEIPKKHNNVFLHGFDLNVKCFVNVCFKSPPIANLPWLLML